MICQGFLTIEEFERLLKTEEYVRAVVAPELAERMLETNTHNRPMRVGALRELTKAIREGLWRYNAQPITFDKEGRLQNGQHRLKACVIAELPIEVLLVFGMDSEVIFSMDRGVSRSVADHLKLCGYRYPGKLAPVVGMLDSIARNTKHTSVGTSPVQAVDILKRWPDLEYSVALTANLKAPISATSLALVHFLFSSADAASADEFVEIVSGRTHVDVDHPVWQLHHALSRIKAQTKATGAHLMSGGYVRFAVEAWNAWHEGRTPDFDAAALSSVQDMEICGVDMTKFRGEKKKAKPEVIEEAFVNAG